MHAPGVVGGRLVFAHADPHHHLRQVHLTCDDDVVDQTRFRRTATGWRLAVRPPPVQRLEYRLLVTDDDGESHVVLDPTNPHTVVTAFGPRSVVEMPGYEEPAWLHHPRVAASRNERVVATAVGDVPVVVWAPAPLDHDVPAPLLVVHDGPEYDRLADLGRWAAAMVATRALPRFRLALLQPVARDDWYAVNPDWPSSVATVLTDLATRWEPAGPVVTMGASLGGLAALQVALAGEQVAPHVVGGVFAQSGSFFLPELDPQEADYPHFARISDWVEALGRPSSPAAPLAARPVPPPTVPPVPLPTVPPVPLPPVVLTCGAHEETHANNVAMARRLRARGHEVDFTSLADLHNYTAWRDGLHPPLTTLLASLWADTDTAPDTNADTITDTATRAMP